VPGPRLSGPAGLRFGADGALVVVAERTGRRLCLLRVADGAFVRHVPMLDVEPVDVEEVAGGWVVATGPANTVVHVPYEGGALTQVVGGRGGAGLPCARLLALAQVPAHCCLLGPGQQERSALVVVDSGHSRLLVFGQSEQV
jgi:hypothetical protein